MNRIGHCTFMLVTLILTALSLQTLLLALPAPGHAMLIPADQASDQSDIRTEDLRKVQNVLEHKMVRQRLEDLGFSPDEITARLNRLSDAQVHEVAAQIDSVLPAGFHGAEDVLHLFLTILLIVAIVVVLVILL